MIPTLVRRPVTTSPAPANEYPRSMLFCRTENYWPSIFERIVGGAYDPHVFPMSFGKIFGSRHCDELLRGVVDVATVGFDLHQPGEMLLVTDDGDRKYLRRILRFFKKMLAEVQKSAALSYVPKFRHIHIDAKRQASIAGQTVIIPRRKTRRIILGCIDPRLLRVRTAAETNDLADAAWFTVPGCLKHLSCGADRTWTNYPLWIRENLRFAVRELGMRWLTSCPHEGCKAHPVPCEYKNGAKSMKKALLHRIDEIAEQIRCLRKDSMFTGVRMDIEAVTLGGQRLATRKIRPGSKKPVITFS